MKCCEDQHQIAVIPGILTDPEVGWLNKLNLSIFFNCEVRRYSIGPGALEYNSFEIACTLHNKINLHNNMQA